jgi:Ala-tRNA(Pro) deacylase
MKSFSSFGNAFASNPVVRQSVREVRMPENKLQEFLASHDVRYEILAVDPRYTAQEIAASAHIPGKNLAKTVMVKLDEKLVMVVLPASYRVNFDSLKKATGAAKVELAREEEFKDIFPDCDVGAMPPFGNLYGMDVYMAESLDEEIVIAFCGGSHSELIRMSVEDFKRLAEPRVGVYSVKG